MTERTPAGSRARSDKFVYFEAVFEKRVFRRTLKRKTTRPRALVTKNAPCVRPPSVFFRWTTVLSGLPEKSLFLFGPLRVCHPDWTMCNFFALRKSVACFSSAANRKNAPKGALFSFSYKFCYASAFSASNYPRGGLGDEEGRWVHQNSLLSLLKPGKHRRIQPAHRKSDFSPRKQEERHHRATEPRRRTF